MADDAASNPSEDVVERIYADGIAMVQLLGPQDRLLRVVEREHRDVQVHVRGNEITLSGAPVAVDLGVDVITELVTGLRTGQGLTADAVERTTVSARCRGVPASAVATGESAGIRCRIIGCPSRST